MVKNPPANAGDAGLIHGLGRSPREGNGNPLWYSCLGNPMDRTAWWATVHGVAEHRTRLSTHPPHYVNSHAFVSQKCVHMLIRYIKAKL